MNITSEIFPTYGSNSSDHFIFNRTEEEIGYDTFSALYLIPFLLGVPINSYVIWLIVTGTGNGLAAEFFSLNLAVCDMFFCVELFLHFFSYKFSFLWMAVYFFDGLAATGRPLFQCLMCVERYLAVVHPVTFLKFKPLRYKVIFSVFIWPICLGSSLFFILNFNSMYLYSFAMLFQFLLYLSIQLFFSVAVLRALKQSGPGERSREKEEENHMKRRAFHLILITTVTMIIIYSPSIVSVILNILTQQGVSVVYHISLICFILGGFVQPVLYLHRTGKCSCFLSF